MQTNVALFLYLEHHGESQLDWELEINILILGVFPGGTSGKEDPHTNAGDIRDLSSPPGLGISPGVKWQPFQYYCLKIPCVGGIAWWGIIHEVSKRQTGLSNWVFESLSHIRYAGIDVKHHPDSSLKKDSSLLLKYELGFNAAALHPRPWFSCVAYIQRWIHKVNPNVGQCWQDTLIANVSLLLLFSR